jgi:hypothetical protein
MSREDPRKNTVHLTELTWRIHATDPEDKIKLRDIITSAIVAAKAKQGVEDYKTGSIVVGNISMFYNPEVLKGRDYKYAKIELRKDEDYKTFIDMKYIDILGNMSRILPNMTKNDIEKYFINPD